MVQTFARFTLHLSPEDVAVLDRRILAILDEDVQTEDERLDQPALAASSSCTGSPKEACRADGNRLPLSFVSNRLSDGPLGG